MDPKEVAVKIHGDQNKVSISYGEPQRVIQEMRFFPANLADAQPPEFESPPLVESFCRDLKNLRMLVLGGHGLTEKTIFARHLAWYLSQSNGAVAVKQWQASTEPQNPEEALRELEASTILLFPGILPQNLGHDLQRLHLAVSSHRHYAILTTDSTLPQWGIHEGLAEGRFWRDPSVQEIYTPEYLSALLFRELQAAVARLPTGLLPEGCHEDAPLIPGLAIREAAVRLETPSRVRAFVNLLRAESSPVRPEAVEELLKQLHGDQEAARRWYRQLDPPRKQLLCLGSAMFDGLFDDQVFAVLEVLVASVWRTRDPLLPHFDYCELPAVEAFFHGTEGCSRTTRIESFSQAHRRALLRAAWDLHRRRILSTLPLMVELVAASVDRRVAARERREEGQLNLVGRVLQETAVNLGADRRGEEKDHTIREGAATAPPEEAKLSGWQAHGSARELFGSEVRRMQLRKTIAETLSEIGLLSLDAVEPSLLELAADSAREVQIVAAVAVARWRDPQVGEHDALLFETLHRWQDEAFVLETSSSRRGDQQRDVFAHVRATVALAASYAAQYDPPNGLAEDLRLLVEKLLGDTNPIVRDRFRSQTLPLVAAWHVRQLEDFLRRKVVLWLDLLESLATGLSAACLLQPEEGLPLLDRWHRETLALPSSSDPEEELTPRETTLATVALAYGGIDSTMMREALPPGEIFDRLKGILSAEDHPFVRTAVLTGMIQQARQDFNRAEPLMQNLVSEVTLQERPFLVKRLTELYLAQRRQLKGGDNGLFIEDRRYPVWTASARPETDVEAALHRWLKDDGRPAAQQLAVQALTSFLETPLERREKALATDRASVSSSDGAPTTTPMVRPPRPRTRLRRASFFGELVVYLSTLIDRPSRLVLRAVFPEVQEGLAEGSSQRGEARSASFLQRLRTSSDEEARTLATHLQRALFLYRHRWGITGAMALLTLLTTIALMR